MVVANFKYQAEKLATARSALLLPRNGGDAEAIATAYSEFELATSKLDLTDLDDDARRCIATVKKIMSTKNVSDPHNLGTVVVRSRQLRYESKSKFARAIDELASWFNFEYWSRSYRA